MNKFKVKILLGFFFATTVAFSQVGIGNTNPKSTLDVTSTYPTGIANSGTIDGITLPSVTRERAQSMTAASISPSTMIYINEITTGTATLTTVNVTAVGIYYWDGSVWQPVKSTTSGVKSTTTDLVLYTVDVDNNEAVNLGLYSFYTVGWTAATAMQRRDIGSFSNGIYFSSITAATTLTNISLNGRLSNLGSNSTASIHIVKYSLGTVSIAYTNTVTGTILGSQSLTINSGIIAPININITSSTSLAAGDILICMLVNTTGNNKSYEFAGQLVTTQ